LIRNRSLRRKLFLKRKRKVYLEKETVRPNINSLAVTKRYSHLCISHKQKLIEKHFSEI